MGRFEIRVKRLEKTHRGDEMDLLKAEIKAMTDGQLDNEINRLMAKVGFKPDQFNDVVRQIQKELGLDV